MTCLGLDRETTWRAVLRGECGVGPLTALQTQTSRLCPPPPKGGRCRTCRPTNTLISPARSATSPTPSSRVAQRDAGRNGGRAGRAAAVSSHRCGFMLGTTLHGMRGGGDFLRTGDYSALRLFWPPARWRGRPPCCRRNGNPGVRGDDVLGLLVQPRQHRLGRHPVAGRRTRLGRRRRVRHAQRVRLRGVQQPAAGGRRPTPPLRAGSAGDEAGRGVRHRRAGARSRRTGRAASSRWRGSRAGASRPTPTT